MRTEVRFVSASDDTVYEIDLPHIPEGTLIRTPNKEGRVHTSGIDISIPGRPKQVLWVK